MTDRKRPYNATITTTDRCLPSRVVSNFDLEKVIDTSDAWIRDRTGISERRFLDDEEPTSCLAIEVANGLLRKRQLNAGDVDLIIVATITPDMVFPSTACLVQDRIGADNAWAYDLSAACSGFVYAIAAGAQFIESGAHERVMVIGADKMSSILNIEDRTTYVLFGDGAGGVLLERSEDEEGLIDFQLRSDGSGGENLCLPGGGSKLPATHDSIDQRLHYVRQEGRAVFKIAVTKMAQVSLSVLESNGFGVEDIDLFVPHQANGRIITATAERMNLPLDKAFVNVDRYANTTNATIPIALSEASDTGRLAHGDLVQLTAFGGGYTWGSVLLRWGTVHDG